MKRMTEPQPRRAAGGAFTLAELLVTLAIIAIAVSIVLPSIGALQRAADTAAGQNTVSLGVDIARAWSTRPHPDLGTAGQVPGADYSGTAAIFTGSGAIDTQGSVRIAYNYQLAKDSGTGNSYEAGNENGYRDIDDLDVIDLPDDTGVAGIHRGGGSLRYVKPPFALTFNEYGNLVNRAYPNGTDKPIYYQTPADDGTYTPPERTNQFNIGDDSRELPTVTGILVYDKGVFSPDDSGQSFGSDTFDQAEINDAGGMNAINGEALFFSPHSGVQITGSE